MGIFMCAVCSMHVYVCERVCVGMCVHVRQRGNLSLIPVVYNMCLEVPPSHTYAYTTPAHYTQTSCNGKAEVRDLLAKSRRIPTWSSSSP